MHVSVKLYSILVKYMPDNAASYPIPEGASLSHLIRALDIPEKIHKGLVVFVNGGIVKDLNTKLAERDEVKMFIAIGGG